MFAKWIINGCDYQEQNNLTPIIHAICIKYVDEIINSITTD